MTTQRSFKRLVRARMDKTGESYTAARAMILAADEPGTPSAPRILATSEENIVRRTGRGWEAWFDLLDEWARPSGRIGRPRAGSPSSSTRIRSPGTCRRW